MKKTIFFLLCAGFGFGVIAQPQPNIYGLAVYEVKLAEDLFSFESTLIFTERESLFQWKASSTGVVVRQDEETGDENIRQREFTDTLGRIIATALADQTMIVRDFCGSRPSTFRDEVKIVWNLKKEVKKIQGISCNLATARFRGRTYEVYYAPSIAVSAGPWKFHGLPGLIFEVRDKKQEIVITLKSLSLNNKASEINWKKQPTIDRDSFYSCLDEKWREGIEKKKALSAKLVAEYPNVDFSFSFPDRRPATELEFE